MKHRTALLLVAALGSPAIAAAQLAEREPIAVVVHPANSLGELSVADLRRFYLGETASFPDGQRVALLEYTPERTRFYRLVLGMTPAEVQQHWTQIVFRGEDASPPKAVPDPAGLRRFVAEHRDALAFLPLSGVDSTVSVVSINGRPPTDSDYPLR